MKLRLSTLLYLIAFAGHSQTNISGRISFYPKAALTVLGFNGIHTKKLGAVKTDAKGRFTLRTPYYGMIKLLMRTGGVELLKDKASDLSFSTTGRTADSLRILKGSSAALYQDYVKDQRLMASRVEHLSYLKALYPKKDPFYKAVQTELKHSREQVADFKHRLESAKGYASYYIPLRKDLDAISKVRNLQKLDDLQTQYVDHLTRDGEGLELSGAMEELIMAYFQTLKMELGKAYDNKKETVAAMDLLDKLDVETPRGQQVASFLMGLFKIMKNKAGQDSIASRVSCLSCHIDETLKRKIKAFQGFKIGGKAPNIVFPKRKKRARSLYDIRSKYKLIIFWASWCPHCQAIVPKINKIYPRLKKSGVEVISVSADFDPVAYKQARAKLSWPYDYADYKKWEAVPFLDYGIAATPTFVLLDARNIVLDKTSQFETILKKTGNSAIHL